MFATHPPDNEAIGQGVGNQFVVRLVNVIRARIERVRDEELPRVDIPIDLWISGKVELCVDSGANCRPRVISDRRYEDLGKESACLPFGVPVAIQSASTCDDQRQSLLQVKCRELIEDIKYLVAKNTCEVAELWIFDPNIIVRRLLKVFVRTHFQVWTI